MKYRLSFCKRIMALAVFLLLSLPSMVISKTCIDLTRGGVPQLLDSMWESKLIIKDGVPETITQPGMYHLLENVDTEILIHADNVVIDLNGFTLSGAADALITVSSEEHYNILIKNGTIKGDNTNIGVKIDENTSGVMLQDLHLSDLDIGINFNGTQEFPVKCSKVDNCFTTSCIKAYVLENVENSVFQDNEVCCCQEAGFDMLNCMFNKIKHCMVVGVGNGNIDTLSVGYKTEDGIDNLFYECFAENIYKTGDADGTSNWCTKAVGFMFTGIERESKIIDCLVDTISTYSWTNSFGILLDMMLRDSNDFAGEQAVVIREIIANDSVSAIDWSPRCGYLATAEDDNSYNVYKFDGTKIKYLGGSGGFDQPVNAVAWSNDGKYLAAVKTFSGTVGEPEIVVYDVDTNEQFNIDNASFSDPGVEHSFTKVVWFHHSKKFVALSGTDVHVFHFDPATGVITDYKRLDEAFLAVAISPDDKYIALGNINNQIKIYNADDLTAVATIETGVDAPVTTLDFNPVGCCGRYFILRGGDTTLQVFDWTVGSSAILLTGPTGFAGTPLALKWHPTGKYFVVSSSTFVNFYTFDPQVVGANVELLVQKGALTLTGDKYVDWSPCGKYIWVAGAVTDNSNMEIFEVGYGVTKCLVDHNKVANCASELCSIGYFGAAGCNCFTRNVSYENCVNFSEGIYNVFYNGLAGSHGPQGNWSIPPY